MARFTRADRYAVLQESLHADVSDPELASGEELVRQFKKGDTVEAVVLAVDPERERISLGIKQLEQDPFGQYMAAHPRGSIVTGTVKDVDAKGATVELADGVEGYVRVSDIAKERIDDATHHLKAGQKVSDLARDKGITQELFETRLVANLRPRLETLVDKKVITQAQADKLIDRISKGHIPFWNGLHPRKK